MDASGVDESSHGPAEGIQLTDHVAFAHPADAGIAAHLANLVEVHGEQRRGHAHAGGDMRSLDPGMPAADHHHLRHGRPLHSPLTLGIEVSLLSWGTFSPPLLRSAVRNRRVGTIPACPPPITTTCVMAVRSILL